MKKKNNIFLAGLKFLLAMFFYALLMTVGGCLFIGTILLGSLVNKYLYLLSILTLPISVILIMCLGKVTATWKPLQWLDDFAELLID